MDTPELARWITLRGLSSEAMPFASSGGLLTPVQGFETRPPRKDEDITLFNHV